MPEADLGDLWKFGKTFDPHQPDFRQPGQNIKNFSDNQYEWIEISLLWRLLGAIVKGCQHMHRLGIMHRDIKANNIFLVAVPAFDDPIMGDWGIRPVLADFGGAMPVQPCRYKNPTDFNEAVTETHAAPEQFIGIPPLVQSLSNGNFGYPMGEKTDVFQIGVTMWSLMIQQRIDVEYGSIWPTDKGEDYALYDDESATDETQRIDNWLKGVSQRNAMRALNKEWLNYEDAEELIDLIRSCLRFHPDKRPSLDDLAESIDRWLEENAGTDDEPDEDARDERFQDYFGRLGT